MSTISKAAPIFFALALILSAGSRSKVSASEVVITSGSVQIGGAPLSQNAFRTISFSFAGNGFSSSGGTSNGGLQGIASPCAFNPCQPGTSISPASTSFLDGVGQSTFGGNTIGAWWFGRDSHLSFVGPDVILPNSTLSTLVITSSFNMSGSVFVHSLDDPLHPIVFSTDVSGSGLATLTFQFFPNIGPGGYVLSSARYDFTSVPEPATLLLLGSGITGLIGIRRRYFKQK